MAYIALTENFKNRKQMKIYKLLSLLFIGITLFILSPAETVTAQKRKIPLRKSADKI
jgi:hypothetical protein